MAIWRKENIMDVYEEMLISKLNKIKGFKYNDIKILQSYPIDISTSVLRVLIENACLSQNYRSIELGRKKIDEIDKIWLKEHFINVANSCINFNDEWEYRRLLELAKKTLPGLVQEVIKRGLSSINGEVREAAMDFNE